MSGRKYAHYKNLYLKVMKTQSMAEVKLCEETFSSCQDQKYDSKYFVDYHS